MSGSRRRSSRAGALAAVGTNQLHLFRRRDGQLRPRLLRRRRLRRVYASQGAGILDSARSARRSDHPAGWVQLYLRDPAGNLSRSTGPTRHALAETLADAGARQQMATLRATLYTA